MNKFLLALLVFNINVMAISHEVRMLNQGEEGYMVFEPAVLEIAVGDTVTFKATDAAHNSASISGMIPEGAKAWSGDLSKDIIVTFDTPGVYGYQCTPHSMMAMVGLIKVGGEATNIEQIKAVAETLKPSFVMNKGRFDAYISKL